MDTIKIIILVVCITLTVGICILPFVKHGVKQEDNKDEPLGVSERSEIRFNEVVEENYSQSRVAADMCATRVAGGQIISGKMVPYQVSMRIFTNDNMWTSFCGGSLVTFRYVLTAAHCIYRNGKLWVRINIIHLLTGASHTRISTPEFIQLQSRKIRSFWKHPLFESFIHDIAVLEAGEKFTLASSVQPIKLMAPQESLINDYCYLSGFGLIKTTPSSHLRGVCMHRVDMRACAHAYNAVKSHLIDTYICAGGEGKDAGGGDSGGPLVCAGYQVGLVTFGGTDAQRPGLYMKIGYYIMQQDLILKSL